MDEYNYGSSNGILLAAVISIIILVSRKKKADEYIPFGPFIVISAIIAIFVTNFITFNNII